MSAAQDKRSEGRIQPFVVRCQVSFEGARTVAYVTDLSSKGARLAFDHSAPPKDSPVEIAVRLGPGAATHLSAVVKWTEAEPRGKGTLVGVRFVSLSREARERLVSAVEEFRAHAAQLA